MSFLQNADFQKQLQEQGYAVVPFLNADELAAIKSFYQAHLPVEKSAFHTTHFFSDRAYKRDVNNFLIDETKQAFKRAVSPAYTAVFANFMVKEPDSNSVMPLHADWSYVDETQHNSYAIWVPLTDTDTNNGCLCVIPYSQHLVKDVRGPRILQWNYPVNETLIEAMGMQLPVKAGEAVVYNHRVMHYSGANLSNETRIAFNISVVPANVPVIHYCRPEGEEEILKLAADDAGFFLEYDNFRVPDKQHVTARLAEKLVHVIDADCPGFINQYGQKAKEEEKSGWLSALWSKFFPG